MHADYMRRLLEPLAVYVLTESINGAELEAVGAQLDFFQMDSENLEAEMHISTSNSYGLEAYEEIMSVPYLATQQGSRPKVLARHLQIMDDMFTLEKIKEVLRKNSVAMGMEEGETPCSIVVRLPLTTGAQTRVEWIKENVLALVPCHMDVTFVEPTAET